MERWETAHHTLSGASASHFLGLMHSLQTCGGRWAVTMSPSHRRHSCACVWYNVVGACEPIADFRLNQAIPCLQTRPLSKASTCPATQSNSKYKVHDKGGLERSRCPKPAGILPHVSYRRTGADRHPRWLRGDGVLQKYYSNRGVVCYYCCACWRKAHEGEAGGVRLGVSE